MDTDTAHAIGQLVRAIENLNARLSRLANQDPPPSITMSGVLDAFEIIGNQDAGQLTAKGAAGTYRVVRFRTGNLTRWQIGADNGAESGSDAGSDWFLRRWNDTQTVSALVASAERDNGRFHIYSGLELPEMSAPGSSPANTVTLYAEDNGAGKTRLMAQFPSGAAQQIAIEP